MAVKPPTNPKPDEAEEDAKISAAADALEAKFGEPIDHPKGWAVLSEGEVLATGFVSEQAAKDFVSGHLSEKGDIEIILIS